MKIKIEISFHFTVIKRQPAPEETGQIEYRVYVDSIRREFIFITEPIIISKTFFYISSSTLSTLKYNRHSQYYKLNGLYLNTTIDKQSPRLNDYYFPKGALPPEAVDCSSIRP